MTKLKEYFWQIVVSVVVLGVGALITLQWNDHEAIVRLTESFNSEQLEEDHERLAKIEEHLSDHEDYEQRHSTCWRLHAGAHHNMNEIRVEVGMPMKDWETRRSDGLDALTNLDIDH